MLQIRFTGLVFGLLFVMHVIMSYSVHAHKGDETVRLGDQRLLSAKREVVYRGRKMGGHEAVRSKELHGEVSKNSGANCCDGKYDDFEENGDFNLKCKSWKESASSNVETTAEFVAFGADYHEGDNDAEFMAIGNFPNQENNQVIGMNKLEAKTKDIGGLEIPRKATLESVSRSPAIVNRGVESKRLLEAAKEIVNLMNKDYSNMPRRKPPINNHVPRH